MQNLKAKWNALAMPAKVAIAAVTVIVSLFIVFKVLPELFDAMSAGAVIALLILPYWIPTIIAFLRHHASKGGVLATNLFLGWTFIGWVLALIWALSDSSAKGGATQTVVVNTTVAAPLPGAYQQPTYQQQYPQPVAYQIGDVVNGHRFNGATWEPLPAPSAPQVPAPPAVPGLPEPLLEERPAVAPPAPEPTP